MAIYNRTDDDKSTVVVKNDSEADLSKELLDKYDNSYRSEWAENVKADDDFRHNVHWTREEELALSKRGQASLSIPITHQLVDQAVSMLSANKPRFMAIARESSDAKVSDSISSLFSYLYDINKGGIHHKQVVDDYYSKSLGYYFAYYDPTKDYGRGEICYQSIDCLNVWVDPASKDRLFRDASHIIVRNLKTEGQVENWLGDLWGKYEKDAVTSNDMKEPASTLVGKEGQIDFVSDEEQKKYEIIDRYSKVKVPYYRINNNGREDVLSKKEYSEFISQPIFIETKPNGEVVYHTEPNPMMEELYRQTGGIYHYVRTPDGGIDVEAGQEVVANPLSIPNSTTKLEKTTMQRAIQDEIVTSVMFKLNQVKRVLSVGGVVVYKDILPIEDYPIIPVPNRHRRNPYPMSDVRFIRPLQEALDKTESLIIAHATRNANPKLLIPKGSADKKEVEKNWSTPGIGVIEYNHEMGTPHLMSPVSLPTALYQRKNELKTEMIETLGMFPIMQGDSSQAPQTYKSHLLIEEASSRRINSKKQDIEESLSMLGTVLLQFIQAYYDEEKILRILMPNNKMTAQEEQMNEKQMYQYLSNQINNILTSRYDIQVVSGSMLPSNRYAKADLYKELFQLGFPVSKQLLENMEIPDAQELAEKMDREKQLQQQVESMGEEIKRLSGDLQTAQRAEVSARKTVEVKDFEKELKNISNRADKAEQLYSEKLQMGLTAAKSKAQA